MAEDHGNETPCAVSIPDQRHLGARDEEGRLEARRAMYWDVVDVKPAGES